MVTTFNERGTVVVLGDGVRSFLLEQIQPRSLDATGERASAIGGRGVEPSSQA
jgi:hypothetical protein